MNWEDVPALLDRLEESWPGYRARAGQAQMARAVAHAMDAGLNLLVEAGTGTGKSVAYTLPAALSALEDDKRTLIATSHKHLQAQNESSKAEQARLEERIKELQAAKADVEQQVQKLTESFAHETKRREGAQQQAETIEQRRSELEAELAKNREAQAQLRQQLEQAQKQLEAVQQSSGTEQSKLAARVHELAPLPGLSHGPCPRSLLLLPRRRRRAGGRRRRLHRALAAPHGHVRRLPAGGPRLHLVAQGAMHPRPGQGPDRPLAWPAPIHH